MSTRSQRHKREIHGGGVIVNPLHSIAITSLSPDTAARETSFTLTVMGADFTGTETIVFDGVEYAAEYISPEEIQSAEPIFAGASIETKLVSLQRGGEVSNELSFMVT
jgi:hypothetical protein